MQDKFSEAVSLLNSWYYTEIRSCADAAVEACVGRLVESLPEEDLKSLRGESRRSAIASFIPYRVKTEVSSHGYTTKWQEREEGMDPREFLTEFVNRMTDDHQFVIFTQQAQMVLAISRNHYAYESEMGSVSNNGPGAPACLAMRADIWEHLEAWKDEWDVLDDEGGSEDISDDEIDIRDGASLESDGVTQPSTAPALHFHDSETSCADADCGFVGTEDERP